MLSTLTRTTILMQPSLLARLKIVSKQQRKPMSSIVQEALQRALETEETARRHRMYAEIDKMIGMIKAPIPDASARIDEVLYGENGVWKGQRA